MLKSFEFGLVLSCCKKKREKSKKINKLARGTGKGYFLKCVTYKGSFEVAEGGQGGTTLVRNQVEQTG